MSVEMITRLLGEGGMTAAEAILTWKLFGPLATHIGQKLPGLTDQGAANLKNVINFAVEKIGTAINEPGQVLPRVFRGAMSEAVFCDDRIAAEYLGGVLASSRVPLIGNKPEEPVVEEDDRGVVINSLIARLSSFQLRTHYILYHALRDLYEGVGPVNRLHAGVKMPGATFMVALTHNRTSACGEKLAAIVNHAFSGLYRESLIGDYEIFGADAENSFRFKPSEFGQELFMWGYGYGNLLTPHFFNPHLSFPISSDIYLPSEDIKLVVHDPEDSIQVKSYWYDPNWSEWCCRLTRPYFDLE
ncbi:hypothetical protein ETAA8_06550 [Anatilimnocola aggregata]|uniref:Uncharacterized protein n=1 Tax=Anatilimnocola aggregata TaxID=2528021 RepID=A0A517Y5S9_9BACT|nr:hypothetical protein [Anatilimnocola aggregata]QDU25585.1 hypothetical protein ETAA8_06550 [Anatilimnocola aggregata]